jgi:hypothetical protein
MTKTYLKKIIKKIIAEQSHYYKSPWDSKVRPGRMTSPLPKIPGKDAVQMAKSTPYRDIYMQDEYHDICIDKYGTVQGENVFDSMISKGNFMFNHGAIIVAEKIKMMRDLGIDPLPTDYYKYNFYELWEKWMQKFGNKKTSNIGKIVVPQVVNQDTDMINFKNPVAKFPSVSVSVPSVTVKKQPKRKSNNINLKQNVHSATKISPDLHSLVSKLKPYLKFRLNDTQIADVLSGLKSSGYVTELNKINI